jgi:hypothetical protein
MTILELSPPPVATALADQTVRQLAAIDAFHQARRAAEHAGGAVTASREVRMDMARRMEVLRREHEVIVERMQHALHVSGGLLRGTKPRTAFIAHRQEWFTGKMTALLQAHDVEVLGHTGIGPDAIGWAVAEQPDLVLVEDTLAMVSGEDVVREIRRYCDRTVIGALVPYSDRVGPLLDAGASTVHVRAVPPAQVVEDLVASLAG